MSVKFFQLIVIAVLSVWNLYALKTSLNVCVSQPYWDYYIGHTLSKQDYIVAMNAGKVEHKLCR